MDKAMTPPPLSRSERLMHQWRTLWAYLAQYLKRRLAYKWDLLLGFSGDLVYQALAAIFILVIFRQTPSLAGWSQAEVFFVYGYFLLPYAVFSALGGGVWEFAERYVVKGEMDRVLLRPVNPLLQVLLESFEMEPLLGVISGIVIMLASASSLHLAWQWYDPLLLLLLVAGSTLVYLGVYLGLASTAFWSDGPTGLMPLVWNVNNYGRYPVDIYNHVLRLTMTWLLPFAFVGIYPAAGFLRRGGFLGFALLTPAMGVLFFGLALWIWRRGLRRYHGTGS